jgi:hypothetical protein
VEGWSHRIEVESGLIAARIGAVVRFYDASDLNNMQQLGDSVRTPGIGLGVAIEGDLVLVGDSMHTLVVIQAPSVGEAQ